jgi:hypothetical protein
MDNTTARAACCTPLTNTCGYELGRNLRAAGDARARLTRALEALQDGEHDFAYRILDNLAMDMWRPVEALEERVVS